MAAERCLRVSLSLTAVAVTVALAVVSLGAGPPARPAQKQIGDRQSFNGFIFATIADSHILDQGFTDVRYIKAFEKSGQLLANYVCDINAHQPPVDFVVHLGDVTELGTTGEFDTALAITRGLTCPLYAVVGNHDNFQSDAKRGWRDFARRDSTTYSFDHLGHHFVVIDCTLDPYAYPYVDCDSTLRAWVAADLLANSALPTIVFSHYNMWERPWNPMFDLGRSYAEYPGMRELRSVLEQAGNVIAVVNGHVHANRVEVHNGIYYIDVGATLVGPPSIRYFRVSPGRVDVTYEYISDRALGEYVAGLCPGCCCCTYPDSVCEFIDGAPWDKQFTIAVPSTAPGGWAAGAPDNPAATAPGTFEVTLACEGRDIRATVCSDLPGNVEVSLNDVLGRNLGRLRLGKPVGCLETDLGEQLAGIREVPAGIYFVRFSLGDRAVNKKIALVP